jgi:transposase-like protein
MRKPIQLERPDLAAEVVRLGRENLRPREAERLGAVRLAMTGKHTLAAIATQVGRARSTVAEWIRLVREKGLDALLGCHQGRGRAPRVQGKAWRELRKGLARGRWRRAVETQTWLAQRHQIHLTLAGTRYWLKKAGES